MSKEYAKSEKINRRGWPYGVWDTEPDYFEWITQAGYDAYTTRLPDGAWVGIILAPFPEDKDGPTKSQFMHTLKNKRQHQFDHWIGGVGQIDQEGRREYCLSMEHYQTPIPKEAVHGPYKNLEEVKQICEDVAQDIFTTHQEGTYLNYFK